MQTTERAIHSATPHVRPRQPYSNDACAAEFARADPERRVQAGGPHVRAAAGRAPRRLAHAASAGPGLARARGPAARAARRRICRPRVHPGRHPRRDRDPRRARGHRCPVRRRARSQPPRPARAAHDQRIGRAAGAPGRLRIVRALRGAQRGLPRAADEDGGQPAARAHARRRPVAAVRQSRARWSSSTPSFPSRARSLSLPTVTTSVWSRRSLSAREPAPTGSRASTLACRSPTSRSCSRIGACSRRFRERRLLALGPRELTPERDRAGLTRGERTLLPRLDVVLPPARARPAPP